MKLLVLKSAFRWFPETFLIASVVYYWISTSLFNPIAIILLLALLAQIYFNNKPVGLILSSLFIMVTLYMFLALFSEFFDVIQVDTFFPDGFTLLFFGGLYLGITLFLSVLFFIKNIHKPEQKIVLE